MKHMMIKVLSLLMALTMIVGVFGTMGISAAEHVHTKGDTVKVVKPTCTSAGYSVYKCTGCSETYEDDILPADKDAHSLKAYYVNGNERGKGAATCTEPAATEGLICARKYCQKVITESEYIKGSEPLGHDYTIELKLPTCEEAGMVYRSCARCVAEELANAEEDVLDEIYSESEKDGFVHLGTVSEIPAENGEHVYVYEITKAPTCKAWGTAKYFCKLCDEVSFESIAVRNTGVAHITEKVAKVEATCTTDGKAEHYKCTVCANTFSDAAGTTAVTPAKIDKTNHANSSFLLPSSDYAVKNGIDASEVNTTGASTVAEALNYMTTLASCSKNAQFYALCADCGEVWSKTFTAAHKYEATSVTVADKVYTFAEIPADGKWYKTANATCAAGVTYVAKCAKGCGNYQETVTSGKLTTDGKHVWGTKATAGYVPTTTPATCTTGAYETWYCMVSGCGTTQIVYTAGSLGHDIYYVCDVDATSCTDCTHANRVKKCTRCVETWAVETAAAHDYKTVDVVASCRVIAHKEDVCQNEGCKSVIVDNSSYTGTVDANNHAGAVLTKTVDATCYTEGTKYYACDCGVKTWTVAIPKLACNGTYTVLAAVPANCNTLGKTEGLSCSVHGVVVAQIDTPRDMTNHNVAIATLKTQVAGTCYIEGYRIYTCGNEKCVDAAGGIAPEFTIVDGKNANNHANKDGVPAYKEGKALTPATHTKVGYHGYKICAYCNVNIELDKAANTATCAICKIAADNQLPSPHRTYAEGEAYTGGILSVVEIPATGHVLTVVAGTPAKHDVAGSTSALVCKDCPDNVNKATGNPEDLVVYGGDVIAPHGDKYMVELKEANCFTSGLSCAGKDYVDAAGKPTKVCAYCERANLRYVAAAHSSMLVESTKTVGNESITVHACSICDAPVVSVLNDEFKDLSDTWYLDNYVAPHAHDYNVNKDDKKDYDETKEISSNEYYGRTDAACQVAYYKVAKCQIAGCDHWEIIETVTAAPGHYIGAKKTPMALGCKTYVAGTACAACGADADDVTHNWGSGDNYGVVKVPTCTESGIALRACIDCGARDPKNPETFGAAYAAYNWAWDAEAYAYVAPALGHSPITLDSYSFSKDSYDVVTYSATCTVCEQKYTEEVNILEDYVTFDVSAKDPNGSDWTANGNTIVVTIAYTAADYKFRDLTLAYSFDTKGLTFQKAEVVADFEGASTEVVVVEDEITIYTFVSAPGKTTVMSGDKVAYVELYFTVNKTGNNVLSKYMSPESILAHVYDEDEKLVADSTKYFSTYISEDISAYVTGDVNNDGFFTPADLLAVMDMIYGEDAQFDAIADVDKDGDVDVDDFAALKTFVLSKKTAKDYIIMVTGEYVDIMPTLLAIAKEETLDADGNGVVTRSDVSDMIQVSSELYWYVHAAEYSWEYGAALNATMIQEADFADILVDAYNALV